MDHDDRIVDIGAGRRDRLAGGRTGAQQEGCNQNGEHREEDKNRDATTGLHGLLLHGGHLAAHAGTGKGFLHWLTVNRVWVVPLFSAVFVVLIEVGTAIAGRRMPTEAHLVLGAFWLFATGKNLYRQRQASMWESYIADIAARSGAQRLSPEEAAVLEAIAARRDTR